MTALAASTSAFDQPGTLGFLVIFGMAVVLYFIFRSMARHLRKVNDAARKAAGQDGQASASDREDGPGSLADSGAAAGRPSGEDRQSS